MKNGIVIDHNEKLTGGQMKNREKPRTLTPSSGAGVRSTPLFDDGNVKLYNGDCFNVLPTVENNSIDLVITSPPFNVGIDYGKGRNEDKKSNKEYHKFACKTMEKNVGKWKSAIPLGDRLPMQMANYTSASATARL